MLHGTRQERRPVRLLARSMLNAAAFALGLAAMAVALSPFAPELPVSGASAKLASLAAHGEEFDVLFIGSSRIYHQLIPGQFDRLMAAGGSPTRSFNLALDGLRAPEDSYLLDRALRGRRAPLRWVIVEPCEIQTAMKPGVRDTSRGVYWHDWPRMGWLLRRLVAGKGAAHTSWPNRISLLWRESDEFLEQCRHGLANGLHIGRGRMLIDALSRPSGETPPPSAPAWDGYLAARTESMPPAELAEYELALTELRRNPPEADYGDPTSQALIRRMQQQVAAAGGRLVLIIPPTLRGAKFRPDPRHLPGLLCLDFADPDRQPQLFAAEHRRDNTHLNRAGSECLTQLLAESLLESCRDR